MSMEDALKQSASVQDTERAEYSAEGYRRLQELRLWRAARQQAAGTTAPVAQLPLGAGHHPMAPPSTSSSSSSGAPGHAMQQLSRSASLDQPPPQQQPQHAPLTARLLRSTSISVDRAPLPLPQRLSRSSSAGTASFAVAQHKQAAAAPLQPFTLPPTRGALAAAAAAAAAGAGAAGGGAGLSSAWAARQPARHSEPGGTASDPLVDMLLGEVELLLAERQQLAARCCSLQRDNEQLAELVGRLSLVLQDHQEAQLLAGPPGYPYGLAHMGPGPAGPGQGLLHHHPGHPGHHSHQAHKQSRVSEWLERRNTPAEQEWAAWQERLPLEHMHSGSSSTLTVALDQQ